MEDRGLRSMINVFFLGGGGERIVELGEIGRKGVD